MDGRHPSVGVRLDPGPRGHSDGQAGRSLTHGVNRRIAPGRIERVPALVVLDVHVDSIHTGDQDVTSRGSNLFRPDRNASVLTRRARAVQAGFQEHRKTVRRERLIE
jgi:hypothetical protein